MDDKAIAEKAYLFFKSQATGVLATISPDNKPEAATVGFVVSDGWNFYILTHLNSRKVKNIESNPSIAFVVGTSLLPQTLQMEGIATTIANNPHFSEALRLFDETEKLRTNPIFAIYKDNYTIIRVEITWVRFLEFDKINNAEKYTVVFSKQQENPKIPTESIA